MLFILQVSILSEQIYIYVLLIFQEIYYYLPVFLEIVVVVEPFVPR